MIFKSGRQTRPRQADRQTHTHIHTHTNSQRERSSKYFIKMNKKCKHQSLCLCAASGSDCADCSGTVNDLTTEQRGSWTRVRACVSFLNYTYCKNVHVTTHTLGSIFDHSSHLCMCVCVCVFWGDFPSLKSLGLVFNEDHWVLLGLCLSSRLNKCCKVN